MRPRAVAAVALVGAFAPGVVGVPRLQDAPPQRLTRHAANDRHPAWSPDGGRIAFESDRDGNWELYLMLSDGSQLRRLTEHPASDRYPAWDPDGRRLVFQSDRSGTPELYILEVASGTISRLMRLDGEEIFPAWSPDGQRIAFSLVVENRIDLFVVGADGTGIVQLTQNEFRDVWPRWSPAGDQLAFFSRRDTEGEDDELYLLNLISGEISRITNSAGHDFCPAWSPDGRHIAAAKAWPGGERRIRILDLAGEPLHELGAGFTRMTEPDLSADGRIAFAGQRNGGYDIFMYTLPD